MTQTLEIWEINNLHMEAQDYEQTLKWNAFRNDAIPQITECLEKGEDLMDLLNDLDLHYDEYDSLTNKEVNELVIEAVKALVNNVTDTYNENENTGHDSTQGWKIVTDFLGGSL